jgi:DNA sulfur modification protein DndE
MRISGENVVEMSWKTFAGEHADSYFALLLRRAHLENKAAEREILSELLRLHITRGIAFLTARRNLNGIEDLLEIAM